MSSRIEVTELTEAGYGEWNRLNAAAPAGSPYAMPEYLDALCSTAGGRFRILVARRGEELVGGLPLYERSSRFGDYVGPRLLLYYNGPVLRSFETKYPSQRTSRQVEILGALADAVAARGYGSVTLKCRSPIDDVRPLLVREWDAKPTYSYVVPIHDLAAQWGRVEQNLRRLVDRAGTQGITLTEDEDFDAFHALHVSTLDRKGAGAYLPLAPFRRWFERLRGQQLCRLYQARLPDGRVVASQITLTGTHPVAHMVSAASDPEFNSTGASAFLRWRSFEALAALGYKGTDLTDAALNPVTHFKSQFGGDLVLCLVAKSPVTGRWRMGVAGSEAIRRARGGAAALVRRILPRSA
jgi:hypothetical protein